MKTLRKILLAVVASLTLLATLSAPAAQANGTGSMGTARGAHRYYAVYYRTCPNSPWSCLGYTSNYSYAVQYVRYIQSYGYDAYLR